MNGNYSGFWQTGGSAFVSGTQGAASGCRCARRCVCPPGRPCRCGGGCTCLRAPVADGIDLWAESGEGELRARGLPPRSAPQLRQRRLSGRARVLLDRRLRLQLLWRQRQRLNGFFARRFGWGQHTGALARLIGCPACAPSSQRFLFALANWQRRRGLRPNGVLTPGLWWRLQALLRQAEPAGGAPAQAAAPHDAPAPGPDPYAAPTDDAPMPLPDDAADGAAAPDDGAELGLGWRGRRQAGVLPGRV